VNLKYTILLLVAGLFLTSCKEEKKDAEISSQMKRVMAIHDEVMPKIGSMGKLIGELSSKEDSTELGMQYRNARRDLQGAHKAMMDWMQDFGNRFDPDEIMNGKELGQQKQLWLDEEEEKVKALRIQINNSIENAKALLENN
jgi:hypothetical protein